MVGRVLDLYQISVHKLYNLFLLKVKLIQNGKKKEKNLIYHLPVDTKKDILKIYDEVPNLSERKNDSVVT